MYLRITRNHFEPSRVSEVRTLVPDVIDALRQLPGCRGVDIGIDASTGESVSVSRFDTGEHARFSREELGAIIGRIQAAGIRMDPPELYELVE